MISCYNYCNLIFIKIPQGGIIDTSNGLPDGCIKIIDYCQLLHKFEKKKFEFSFEPKEYNAGDFYGFYAVVYFKKQPSIQARITVQVRPVISVKIIRSFKSGKNIINVKKEGLNYCITVYHLNGKHQPEQHREISCNTLIRPFSLRDGKRIFDIRVLS